MLARALAAVTLACCLAGAAHAAEPLPVVGSVVSLVPPPGFAPSKDFAGFQGRSASIVVADMDGTYPEITAAMAADKAAADGLKVAKREDLAGLPFKAALFTATQTVGGKTADKWLLVAERPGGVSLINATSLHGLGNLDDTAAHALMRSVRLSATAFRDPSAGLGFAIDPPSALAYRQPVAGTGLTMTAAAPTADNADQPAMFVSPVFQQPVPFKEHVAAFAYAISNMKSLTLAPNTAPTPLTINGLDALQAAMTGTNPAGEPVEALATLVFAPARAYLILGTAKPAAFPAVEPGFRAATASFKLKP